MRRSKKETILISHVVEKIVELRCRGNRLDEAEGGVAKYVKRYHDGSEAKAHNEADDYAAAPALQPSCQHPSRVVQRRSRASEQQ